VWERRLFDRSNKGIRPRAITEVFLNDVREMERHAATMLDELGQSQQAKTRPVRIATMERLASGYFARRINAIADSNSGIRVEFFSNPHTVDLLKKETDIFLSFLTRADWIDRE
jgi:DNA-binding transcriptional LysR family regulator